jgi:flagellum-specific peptidoglycan hydrolase FlgJ
MFRYFFLFVFAFTLVPAFSQKAPIKKVPVKASPSKAIAPPELNESIKEVASVIADSFNTPVATVERFIQEAMLMEQKEKIPATFFIGLAILESAGFSSYLYKNASNPFGMKATKEWKGEVFMMYHEGTMTAFRQYAGPKEAVQDFSKFLRSRRWYRDALACPVKDYDCFLEGLKANPEKKEPGYARDPEWANKIRRVINTYNLTELN